MPPHRPRPLAPVRVPETSSQTGSQVLDQRVERQGAVVGRRHLDVLALIDAAQAVEPIDRIEIGMTVQRLRGASLIRLDFVANSMTAVTLVGTVSSWLIAGTVVARAWRSRLRTAPPMVVRRLRSVKNRNDSSSLADHSTKRKLRANCPRRQGRSDSLPTLGNIRG